MSVAAKSFFVSRILSVHKKNKFIKHPAISIFNAQDVYTRYP